MRALRIMGKGIGAVAMLAFAGLLILWNLAMNVVGILLCAISGN